MKQKKLSEIKGFENCVEYILYDDGSMYSTITNKFLKPLKDTKGYYYYDIRSKDALYKCPKVHKLVMLAFSHEEPTEHINHIDGDKSNNHISNLEWCTNEENRIHALNNDLKDEVDYWIAQCDLTGELLNIFRTCEEALIYLGKNPKYSGNIGRVIRCNRETAYGYKWMQYKSSTTIS